MLYLLVALPAEARPLRAAYGLTARDDAAPFSAFTGDGVELVVSGIGKTAMAAACGWLAARAEQPGLWLNLGIAGHRELALGSPFLAHRVVDRATGRSFYPPLVFTPPCAGGILETVDRPELDYPEPHAYDMEGSAFVEVAQKVAGAELAQVLKVISDRSREDLSGLTGKVVGERIESLLPAVAALRLATGPLLEAVVRAAAEPPLVAELLAGRHFTWSDRGELRRLLRRHAALGPPGAPPALPAEVQAAARGRELNRRLASWLDSLPWTHEMVLPAGGEGA